MERRAKGGQRARQSLGDISVEGRKSASELPLKPGVRLSGPLAVGLCSCRTVGGVCRTEVICTDGYRDGSVDANTDGLGRVRVRGADLVGLGHRLFDDVLFGVGDDRISNL